MSLTNPVADEEMIKTATGDEYDHLTEPPRIDAPTDHPKWPLIKAALKEIYDPEIPVNIYELGLIVSIDIAAEKDGAQDVVVKMTLTSPGCPVAQEMPGWVQGAIFGIDGIGEVDVELTWDEPWDPSFMAETAKMQLNMFM